MTEKDPGTQLERAARGEITPEMEKVARKEGLSPEKVREEVAAGRMVIPANPSHRGMEPIGIGMACRTKVNANIGNSSLCSGIEEEIAKMRRAVQFGADTVMDLSTGGDLDKIRTAILAECPVPLGTVPIYQAVKEAGGKGEDLDPDRLLEVIDRQGSQGVDYITVHCGVLRDHLPLAGKRVMGIVSRGGSLMAAWMKAHGEENPLYARFDDLLEIARRHDMTLSLGDGLRPGCLADASDDAQFAELRVLGELVRRARKAGVQAMVEGPGHIPLDQIRMNVEREIQECDGAPFYLLGPVVTDVAPGYDHLTSAIGGTLAAFFGASMLCYVTPMEHLGLPGVEDVRRGVIASRIAAHAADVARGRPGARDWDDAMARARIVFDWEKQFELAMDPERARELRSGGDKTEEVDYCTMCGPEFCAMRISNRAFGKGGEARKEERASEAGGE